MKKNNQNALLRVLTIATIIAAPVFAQYNNPPMLAPAQLDNLVNRIALYPDPLLAQVLAAATYSDQIPDAASFANQYRGLQGDALADVTAQANLPFDPSVQSLIPFPDVLNMMASDMNWTNALGNAVLAQRPDVMDAVQTERRLAQGYGYLRSNDQEQVIADAGYVSIVPVNPAFVCVPVYDPYVVFAAPRPGFFVGGAITFRTGFAIGARFGDWGWGGGFNWRAHSVVVNHVNWNRTWVNRSGYIAGYRNWNVAHREVVQNHPVTINRSITVNRYENENNRFVNNHPAMTTNNFVQNRTTVTNNNVPNRGFEQHPGERSFARPMQPVPQSRPIVQSAPQGRPAMRQGFESHDRGGRRER